MLHPLAEHIEEKIFSVGEYLELINELLGPLKVRVEGEISDLKILPQWVFFSLKDVETGEILRCGLHNGAYKRLGVNVEEGMTVRVVGYGKVSPKTGNFGFWVSKIEPLGEGALRRAYEILVKKLEGEGLFERKRDLPQFISHIGVISSRNGVVIQDLMKNLSPLGIRVDFIHSGVEGTDSAVEIERAIRQFSAMENAPEVLVLIRGGGSLESLQGFNNEAVVRALFAAPMPVLVGIGHDVDVPIATLVADWSASTPTAVAHVINKSWSPLTEGMPTFIEVMKGGFLKRMREVEHRSDISMEKIRHSLTHLFLHFEKYRAIIQQGKEFVRVKIKEQARFIGLSMEGMRHHLARNIQRKHGLVLQYERLLTVSDPKHILERGFGLVYKVDGTLVRTLDDIKEGEKLITQLKDGVFDSEVTKKKY